MNKLEKIISKAIDGGWDDCGTWLMNAGVPEDVERDIKENEHNENWYYAFIFNHDFLKAYFGEEEKWVVSDRKVTKEEVMDIQMGIGSTTELPRLVREWQYHAQQLVLESDRIEYLWRFIENS